MTVLNTRKRLECKDLSMCKLLLKKTILLQARGQEHYTVLKLHSVSGPAALDRLLRSESVTLTF